MTWWYLSFVDPDSNVFIGSAVVKGDTEDRAVSNSWKVGVNPGGEIGLWRIPDDVVVDEVEGNRFYSLEEMMRLGHLTVSDLPPNTLVAWNARNT